MSAVIAGAAAAPTYDAGVAPLVASAPLVAAPAPVAYAQHQVVAPAAISVPAPYSTEHIQGPDAVSIEAPAPIVTKSLSYGKKQFVSGHISQIHKPAIPDFRIQVPTALKGSITQTAPVVKHATETHVVNQPVAVERRVEVPYDVPVYKEVIHEKPVAVPVVKHVPVKHPVAVRGHDIIQNVQGAPIVHRTHEHVHHAQAVAVGYAQTAVATPAVGYAHTAVAAPAVGYAQAAVATPAVGYTQAAVGYAGSPAVYSGQYGYTAGYGAVPGHLAYAQPAATLVEKAE